MNGGGQDCIISEWLRSLGLQQYSASFYDNGYDELELCKQIEQADLDAIGVMHPLHRKILLDSAMILRSEGATSVYFTLEDRDVNHATRMKGRSFQNSVDGVATPTRELIYDVSPRRSRPLQLVRHPDLTPPSNQQNTSFTNPPGRLAELVKDKLTMERVDITASPYTQSGNICVPVVTALAMRYAEELSQDYFQVMTIMEQMVHGKLYPNQSANQQHYKQGGQRLQCYPEAQPSKGQKFEMFLGHANPPAIPSCPPPQHNHMGSKDKNGALDKHSKMHQQPYQRSQSAYSGLGMSTRMYSPRDSHSSLSRDAVPHPADCHLEHTCGRSKSFQGDSHIPHSCLGGSPGYPCTCPPKAIAQNPQCREQSCKDVALFEQKRLDALMQVRAGKISVEEAMARIKLYEKQIHMSCEKKSKKKSTTAKIGEFFKLPSFRRKNKDKLSISAKSTRSMSCSETGYDGPSYALGSSVSTSQLAEDFKSKCTCGMQGPTMNQSRSMNFTPVCSCDECQRLRSGAFNAPPPPSPMLGHRSTTGGVRGSARYPSNRRIPIGADIVRAPPTCRQCNTPLNQPQKVLPKFYSPQVTRKTYQPLTSPTPHHYIKPFSDKFDAWYQQNLPSDDETRQLIDPNQSDDSSMNISFDVFGPNSRSTHHSIVSPSLLKGNLPQSIKPLTPQPISASQPLMPQPINASPQPINATQPKARLQTSGNTTSDLGNCSYHSDSLSSDDVSRSTVQNRQKPQQTGSDTSPTVVRGRRDSGCYLSNENINNNSSNSSTCEKTKLNKSNGSNAGNIGGKTEVKTIAAIPECSNTCGETDILENVKRQMMLEGIDLTSTPYTDEQGQWCVPISLVSRYAQLCGTDLTTVALAMDAARCTDLQSRNLKRVALSADTKRNPEQKRITNVRDFLILSGLPMYFDLLVRSGCDTLNSLAIMNEEKLRQAGINDPLHLDIIVSAIQSTWNTENIRAQEIALDEVSTTTPVHQV